MYSSPSAECNIACFRAGGGVPLCPPSESHRQRECLNQPSVGSSVHSPQSHVHFSCNLTPRKTLGAQGQNFGRVYYSVGPSNPLAFSFRVAKASFHAFLNQCALKFCHRSDDLKHQPT